MDNKDIAYYLDQINQQLGSVEWLIKQNNLSANALLGFIGEVDYQLQQLKEIAEKQNETY